jgi:hypothetical protein
VKTPKPIVLLVQITEMWSQLFYTWLRYFLRHSLCFFKQFV